MKRFGISSLLLLASLLRPAATDAQIYAKLNGLYALVGVVNPAVEFRLTDHSAFQTEFVYSPWKSINVGGSRLELLECGLQCGLVGLVALITHTRHLNALLGRLNIRQTKHLLRLEFAPADKKSTVQNGILAKNARNCKHFFEIF